MLSTWGCTTFPKPTLDLQFEGATSLDSRITFSRGSQATLFDSTGTLVYAKHNLLTYSQDFGDSAWAKGNSSALTDVTTAPDGTSTADSLADNTANDVHNVTRSIAWTAGAVTASFFVKYFNHRWIQVRIGASGNQFWGSFDLLNGVVGSATAGATTAMTSVGNGWYRITVSATLTTAGSANLLFQLGNADVTALVSYVGTGTLVYLWGAQLNLANMEGGVTSSLTTYYPTTTAAYYGPRFDYDPSTLAARGLLIEEARTNVYIYSEELDNAAWTVNGVTVSANAGVSPTGATTADNVIPTAVASTFKEVQQNFSSTLGTTYTFSVFAKSNGYRYVQLVATSGSFGNFAVNYDLDTGTETAYTAGTSTVLQRSITPIKNGWYRLSISVTALATSAASRFSCDIIPASNSARGVSWAGDGTSGVLMWGMQTETGAFPTSYIPTTTTALTRSADVASMTGTNFSSWFNAVEGTVVTQAIGVSNISGATRRFVEISDGTVNDRFVVGYSATTNTRFLVTDGGATQADITVSTGVPAGSLVKMAAAYKVNDFQQASNGTLGTADTSGTLPTVDRMFLGVDTNATTVAAILNGHIQRISYYPSRLANATLQALTA